MGNRCCLPTIEGERVERKDKPEARAQVCKEVISSEQVYVKGLRDVVSVFLTPIEHNRILKQDDIISLFSNVRSICEFHEMFYIDLQSGVDNIPAVFDKFAEYFRVYTQYVNTYSNAISSVERLTQRNRKFRSFISEKRRHGYDLMSHLILPIQRVPRYEMLLREIRKYTPTSHPQYRTLEFAFDKIKRVAKFINEQKREFESRSKVLQIQQEVTDRPASHAPLTSDKRSFIREGNLGEPGKTKGVFSPKKKTCKVFLFSDFLLWTSTKHKWQGELMLKNARVSELISDDSKLSQRFPIEVVSSKSESAVFLCDSENARQDWLSSIERAIHDTNQRSGWLPW